MNRTRILAVLLTLSIAGAFASAQEAETPDITKPEAQKSTLKTPSTLIHHVTLKWKAEVSDADKQKALDGLKEIVADVPGALNLWIKPIKIQPREFSQTFVIEFENEAALKAYADHPMKKGWNEFYYGIREASFNSVTTN